MTAWHSIKDGIDRFVLWTKDSVVLSAAAKVALRSIPVVGPTLADIYEEAGGDAGDAQANAALVREILARIEAVGAAGVEESIAAIEEAQRIGVAAHDKLIEANRQLAGLDEELRKVRADMAPMKGSLERLEAEVVSMAWGATDFDPDSPGDRVTFLVLLKALLDRSSEIFRDQLRIAESLIQHSHLQPPNGLQGKDDVLWWLSKHGGIAPGDRPSFRELRAVTNRMKAVNLRARWLIRRNRDALPAEIPADTLEAHLSIWLAKYEYLSAYDDEHMALVFVGAAPTNQPFPSGVDAQVDQALRRSMQDARLHHVL